MCDCDIPEVWEQKTRTARKPHKCDECGQQINKGDRYTYSKGLYDRQWFDNKTCSHCQELIDFFAARDKEFCFCLGELMEAVREYLYFEDLVSDRSLLPYRKVGDEAQEMDLNNPIDAHFYRLNEKNKSDEGNKSVGKGATRFAACV